MAGGAKYKFCVTKDILKTSACANNGIGVGSLCGPIIGGIMVIGIIFEKKIPPEHTPINHIRMKFIDMVNKEFGAINCSQISKLPQAKDDCEQIISTVARILDDVIAEFI